MKNLSINHVAVLTALALHVLLLAVSVRPGTLPLERPQRISVRLLPAAGTTEPAPVPHMPQPVKPRPVIEKEIQRQVLMPTRIETPPSQVEPKAIPKPEPAPTRTFVPVAAAPPAAEPTVASTQAMATATPAPVTESFQEPPPAAARTAAPSRLHEYLTMVREAVEVNKDYPAFARQLGQQGTAVVRAEIDRDGRLLRAAILSSSGYKSLDKAALAAVRNAGRFRAPAEFDLTEVTVDIPIAYKLI